MVDKLGRFVSVQLALMGLLRCAELCWYSGIL